jgi:hypothetical protein
VDQRDPFGVHIRHLDRLPCDIENKLGLVPNFGPIGVQKSNSLLTERPGGDIVEKVKGFFVKFFYEGHVGISIK